MRNVTYKNEAAFSRAFVKELQKNAWFVQRIETGTTGRGVPDIYAIAPWGVAYWFELKRVHSVLDLSAIVTIPWRPGQQSWMFKATSYGQRCITVAAFDNVICVIRNKYIYKDNKVDMINDDVPYAWSLHDAVAMFKMGGI